MMINCREIEGQGIIANRGVIHVDRIAIIQYVLIYIVIQYIGGRLLAYFGTDTFYAATIVLCLALIWLMPNRLKLYKKFVAYMLCLSASLFFTFIITSGSLSVGTILSILSRFLLVYTTILIDRKNFIERFLKLVFIMAIISIVEFALVQIVGDGTALALFSHLTEIKNGNSWLGNSYGLFFICYNFMDSARNAYMFGEPGEYQSLLVIALYFLTFRENEFEQKTKFGYYTVFLIALITAQSTTGFLNLIVFTIAILLSGKNRIPHAIRSLMIILLIALAVYINFFYNNSGILYDSFFGKIFNDSGNMDLTTNTGAARIGPMERFGNTLKSMPEKMILGVGYDGLAVTPLKGYSTVGIINLIAMAGFISFIMIYGYMMTQYFRHSNSFAEKIFVIFFVINMGMSQPDLLAIMPVLMCLCDEYSVLGT